MGFVRVAPEKVGRLVRVSLAEVDDRHRAIVSRRLREQRWEDELRPDTGYSPTMKQRIAALADAVALERAATRPSPRGYLIPEDAADAVLAKHGLDTG